MIGGVVQLFPLDDRGREVGVMDVFGAAEKTQPNAKHQDGAQSAVTFDRVIEPIFGQVLRCLSYAHASFIVQTA